ncbi:MAG: hypothetical protein AB8G14_06615 [Ilumatobacter sp.]
MATTKKHPRELTDTDVDGIVAAFDEAVDQGRVRQVDGVVFRELRAAASGRRAAEERLEAAVVAAKEAGLSWGAIGAQLGVTRQGARQRFERLLNNS